MAGDLFGTFIKRRSQKETSRFQATRGSPWSTLVAAGLRRLHPCLKLHLGGGRCASRLAHQTTLGLRHAALQHKKCSPIKLRQHGARNSKTGDTWGGSLGVEAAKQRQLFKVAKPMFVRTVRESYRTIGNI